MPINYAWQTFIEARRNEAGRAVAEDSGYKRLFDEFQGTIDALNLQIRNVHQQVRQARVGDAAPGDVVNVQPAELVNVQMESLNMLVDRLERIRDLNDELIGIVEEKFYTVGLQDGVSLAQWLVIHEAGNDGNDYLEACLDDHIALAAEIAREYDGDGGEGLRAS